MTPTALPTYETTPAPTMKPTGLPETPLPPGALYITSFPSGATIYLDGKGYGVTPNLIQNLTPRSYELRLSLVGWKDYRIVLSVSPGQTYEGRRDPPPLGIATVSSHHEGDHMAGRDRSSSSAAGTRHDPRWQRDSCGHSTGIPTRLRAPASGSSRVSRTAIRVMKEAGIDISAHRSKSVTEYWQGTQV